MKRTLRTFCLIVAVILFGGGIYAGRLSKQIERRLLDEYQIYSNPHVISYDKWLDDIPGSFVFPGTEAVVHILSKSEAFPFEIQFMPIVIKGDTVRWYSKFSKSVDREGRARVDFYRGLPWDMKKVGTGVKRYGPSTSLRFGVVNNPDLSGKRVSYRIITDDFEHSYDIAISSRIDFRARFHDATGGNWASMLSIGLLFLSFAFLWITLHTLRNKNTGL